MLTFFIGQAQGGFAMGAGAVAMGLTLGEPLFLNPKPAGNLALSVEILYIFCLPFINIFPS